MKTSFPRSWVWVLGGCLCLGSVVPAQAETNASPDRPASLSLGGRFSGDVQEFFVDLRAPIAGSARRVLLLNPRASFLEDREQELNLGLVVRHMTANEKAILGANLFYDGRWTASDNYFGQVGAGVEALTRHLDFRANYYYPVNDPEAVATSRDTVIEETLESGRTVGREITSTYTEFEEALEGADIEAGLWIPGLSDHLPTAVFVGYYYFMPDHLDDLHGAWLRLECRPRSWLTLNAEWFDDKPLNGTDYFVGFKVHAPLAFWKKSSWTRATEAPRTLEGRMTEMVVRDFRIRTIRTGPGLTSREERIVNTRGGRGESSTVTSPYRPPPEPPETIVPQGPQYDEDGNIIL